MAIIIFIVGLLVSSAVCYALFAYTIHEMGSNEKTNDIPSELTNQPIKLTKQPIK
jgi:archaellum component FlaG (FlaF/FlaG flagellin family)